MAKTYYKSTESYAMLYHLYRVRIVAKSDLTLYRGKTNDRYAQQLLKDHISANLIKSIRYNKCEYCMLTETGRIKLKAESSHGTKTLTATQKAYLEHQKNGWSRTSLSSEKSENEGMDERSRASGAERCNGTQGNLGFEWQRVKGTLAAETLDDLWEPRGEMPIVLSVQAGVLTTSMRKKLRAAVRRGGVENLMYGSGVVLRTEDKAPFQTMIKTIRDEAYADTFAWKQVMAQGVYYTKQEMKGGYPNRILGVLLTGDGWYAVYNTLGQMLKWNAEAEREENENLQKLFNSTIPYRSKDAQAIVCAAGRSMASTIVSGHKYGHNRSKTLPEFVSRTPYQQLLMNSRNLQGLYKRVYLVEMNSAGLETLKHLVKRTRAGEQAELAALADANPDLFSLTTTVGGKQPILYEIASGNRVIISHCYELISLYEHRNSTERYTYIGSQRQLEQTAKCLYDHLTSYIDLETGCAVDVPDYNEKGDRNRNKRVDNIR